MRRILPAVAALAAVAVVAATPASAGARTPTYTVAGIETGIPTSDGDGVSTSPFAGVAFSWTAGFATWTADVTHHSLADCARLGNGCITGGDFSISGRSTTDGTFEDGSITLLSGSPAAPCTSKVVYGVTGDLSGGGFTTFTAKLTHYQVQLGSTCVPYFATVSGRFG